MGIKVSDIRPTTTMRSREVLHNCFKPPDFVNILLLAFDLPNGPRFLRGPLVFGVKFALQRQNF